MRGLRQPISHLFSIGTDDMMLTGYLVIWWTWSCCTQLIPVPSLREYSLYVNVVISVNVLEKLCSISSLVSFFVVCRLSTLWMHSLKVYRSS